MNWSEKDISIQSELDVVLARIAASDLTREAGFGVVAKYCVITSVSELANNILYHVGEGSIILRIILDAYNKVGIEVVATDHGKGIADIPFALKDGTSTLGTMGAGLPGVNRMMSELHISSSVGEGTEVRAIKWASEDNVRSFFTPRPATISDKIQNR